MSTRASLIVVGLVIIGSGLAIAILVRDRLLELAVLTGIGAIRVGLGLCAGRR